MCAGQFWQKFFVVGHPTVATVSRALVGPLIAGASSNCSVGNVPFTAVLWNSGINFGGVASFIVGQPRHPSPPQQLPEVLRSPDNGISSCDVLSCDGLGAFHARG
ncbi:permease [Paraburkholderia graminis]|uniref:permease n=1 Tax=Paraburkholderia graminis TaxID=60548 RepID=UPI00286C1618|nr:permease [Paraburkholderia graminis]